MTRLEKLKSDPYLKVPEGYQVGENLEEDEKYKTVQEDFLKLVEEIHELETQAREGD